MMICGYKVPSLEEVLRLYEYMDGVLCVRTSMHMQHIGLWAFAIYMYLHGGCSHVQNQRAVTFDLMNY